MTGEMSQPTLQVFFIRDGELARTEVFAEGLYTVGRSADADLRLDVEGVEPLHALLEFKGGNVKITAHAASSGVEVNGERVSSAQITQFDEVKLGQFTIKTRLVYGSPRPKAAVPPRTIPPAPAAPARPAAPVVPQAASTPVAKAQAPAPVVARPAPVAPPPAPATPRLGGVAPPVMRPVAASAKPAAPRAALPSRGLEVVAVAAPRMPPPPPPPEVAAAVRTPVKAVPVRTKESSDLDELDFLFDAALAQTSPPAPLEAPVVLDLEESSLLLRALDAPPEEAELSESAPDTHNPFEPAKAQPAAPAVKTEPPPAQKLPAETVQIERTQWFEAPPDDSPSLQLASEKMRALDRPVARPSQPPARRTPPPPAALAKIETARVPYRKPAAAAPMAGIERRAPAGSMLMASIFWGDTLLLAQTFRPGKPVLSDRQALAALQLYGFADGGPVVESKGSAWSVVPPAAAHSELREGQRWAAAPSGSREIRLEPGAALRLTSGRFHLQLSAETAPRIAQVMFWQHVDQRLFYLVFAAMVAVFGFIVALPKPRAQLPVEMQKEIIHQVRMSIERQKKEKPKPPPPQKKEQAVAEKKTPPPVLAQATTLKQAQTAVPLKSIDKLQKATRGLGNLLAMLGPPAGKKGGNPSALPLLPTVGSAPAPLPGLGGTGAGGSVGPVTKGSELLRGGGVGGLLGSSTAGRGSVQGVPVSMPTRATQIRGSIDRDAVAKVINEHLNDVRGCYERALVGDPNLGAGKVLLEWTINSSGVVIEVRTKLATLRNTEATRCMIDVVKQMQFPKPSGGNVIVSYPFLFNSVGL
jgi:hypothetical protein